MNESVERKSAEVAAIKPPSFLAFIARALQPRIPRKRQTGSIISRIMTNIHIADPAQTGYCTTFHFPSVCPFVCHRRDISTFLNYLMI